MHQIRGSLAQLTTCVSLVVGTMAPALAATVEFGAVTVGSSNLGNTTPLMVAKTGGTFEDSLIRNATTQVSSATSRVVQSLPTETSAGLNYVYRTDTTTQSWLEDAWRYSNLLTSVSSSGLNMEGGKYISIAGTVSSLVDLSVAFALDAGGRFTPTSTPFGAAVPLLASLYFGDSAAPVLPSGVLPVGGTGTSADLSTTSYNIDNTYNSATPSTNISLIGGTTRSFLAYVYAGSGVSIDRFNLSATSGLYDFSTTARQLITVGEPMLIGAETISPIPEADPAMMLAAGLGLAAAIAGRRRRIEPI